MGVMVRLHTTLLVTLLAAVLVTQGCSSARNRDEPGAMSLLSFRDSATADYLSGSYRTGSLYLDFRPALIVDAILEDARYQAHYLQSLGTHYMLPPDDLNRMRSEFEERFATQVNLLVFLYEGRNDRSRLTPQEEALWRLMLRDDDGTLRTPLTIARIKEDSVNYAYLSKYFDGLDRWSHVYRVSFAKLSKGTLKLKLGENPFELIITGVKGTVVLRWPDVNRFYASEISP